ncbi:MAG: phytanoyl-CoA dioxygenase family protein [Acaryochloridaceae cyanobacterium SU_2_1]|nr:phytanoyl-CoA dioxygenase family protein [Acaryochloridaceae cyanobacterium SU_2_1]
MITEVLPTLLEEFNAQGYVIRKGLFSPIEAQTLIKDIQAAETIDGISALNKGSMTFYSGIYANSQPLQATISQTKVIDFLKQFIGPDFWVRWDQAVAKGPGSGTFPWHQDNAYNSLKDRHYQLWIALTKTTADNGGLWIVPGSHHHALPHNKIGNHMVYAGQPQDPILIEAEPGDVILFSSFTLHSTSPNVTQAARWAYVVEYMSLNDYDPGAKAPYFIVARNGQPTAKSVDFYRGQLNPLNHLKYWRWHLRNLLRWFGGFKF